MTLKELKERIDELLAGGAPPEATVIDMSEPDFTVGSIEVDEEYGFVYLGFKQIETDN